MEQGRLGGGWDDAAKVRAGPGFMARLYEQRRRTDPHRQASERKRKQSDHARRHTREWQRRRAMPRWAVEWEDQRRADDLAELNRRIIYGVGAQRINGQAERRSFIGRICAGCGAAWVAYEARHDCELCSSCNRARWRQGHRGRARQYGVAYEDIDPFVVFRRDSWRCQICGYKVVKKWPSLRHATLDHIVPMSRGGEHVVENLQTACLSCNSKKGAGAANDQLRLAV